MTQRAASSATGGGAASGGAATPALVGVIHLRPLPGSPRFGGSSSEVVEQAARDAAVLADAGFDGVIVENFGDAPFARGAVDPVTVAAMTRCALAVRAAAGRLVLGVNVLRNDAQAALAVALAADARLVRINVHCGARLTDQGLVQGEAHHTLRRRRALGLGRVALWCDVAVKHSAPLAPRPIAEEARELAERGLADAVLVTGAATGQPARSDDLHAVRQAVNVPVLVASGVRPETLPALREADGVVVGSWLRADGRAGGGIDATRAASFAEAFRRAR